jgi:hypothetical protein
MKSQSRKAKGRELQKHCAKVIREVLDLPDEDVVSRPMGSAGEDIMLSKRARKLLPYDIECKNTKSFPSLAALKQAKDRGLDLLPAAVWKPFGKGMEESIIYFNLREFLELWKEMTNDEDSTT